MAWEREWDACDLAHAHSPTLTQHFPPPLPPRPITLPHFLRAWTNVRGFNLVLVTELLGQAGPEVERVLGW